VSADLDPLVNLLIRAIREGPVIQMDETPVTVLKLDRSGTVGLSGVIIKRQRGHDKTTRGGTLRKHYQSGVGTLSRPAGWSGLRPSFL